MTTVRYQFYSELFKIYTIVDTPEEAGEEIVVEGNVCGIPYQIIKINIYVPITSSISQRATTNTPEPRE